MGRRASLFDCKECGNEFWEWFEWMDRNEMINFAKALSCPECGSKNWELTDASEFAGGRITGEAAVPNFFRGIETAEDLRQYLDINKLEGKVNAIGEEFKTLEQSSKKQGQTLDQIIDLLKQIVENRDPTEQDGGDKK